VHLWVADARKNNFNRILKNLKSNISHPKILGKRIYFISDHEGIGNIYSCAKNGSGMKRHSHESKFYVRSFSIFKNNLVYQSAGDLFFSNLSGSQVSGLKIELNSNFVQAEKRYEDADEYLEHFSISSSEKMLSVTARGNLFAMKAWSKAPQKLGENFKRYRQAVFLKSKKGASKMAAVKLGAENKEHFVEINLQSGVEKLFLPRFDLGKVYALERSQSSQKLAFSNNRNEAWLVDFALRKKYKMGSSVSGPIKSFSFSPCDNFIVFSAAIKNQKQGIFVFDIQKKKSRLLMEPVFEDFSPVFSPCGNYLYFLSVRDFFPHFSESHFEMAFPSATKIYGVALNKDVQNVFERHREKTDEDSKEEKEKKLKKIKIDFKGMEQRVFALPLSLGGYRGNFTPKLATLGSKLFYLKSGIDLINPRSEMGESSVESHLYCFDFSKHKSSLWHKDVSAFDVATEEKSLLVCADSELRIISSESKANDGEEANKKDGYIDLGRITLQLDPKKEWPQMFEEAWLLQRENFWTEDMSKIDWEDVYEKYFPLLKKIHTRSEMSDLLWEMQGELGTSHCYEWLGDFPVQSQDYAVGNLGSEYTFHKKTKSIELKNLSEGDSWIFAASSALKDSNYSLENGDRIYKIDGEKIAHEQSVFELLENKVHQEISLEIKRKKSSKKESIHVRPRATSFFSRYREWVNKNKKFVHEKTKGQVGYVHVPNMWVWGYSEFYRNYLSESSRNGLIVDVRFNSGGAVSQLLLKMLAQRTLGFGVVRHDETQKYPAYSINGPLLCLTNEYAGSDGDIFSHSFKLLKLGKLVGKRTWGGVIGMWPKFPLVDGTWTTQPEFSYWFQDVEWSVENYGTNPDIEVENTPQDYARGKDAQLDRGVLEILKDLKSQKPLKLNEKKNRPNLKAPKLPRL